MESILSTEKINELLNARNNYRKLKSWEEADSISKFLKQNGIICIDNKDGSLTYTTEEEIKQKKELKISKNQKIQEKEKLERIKNGYVPKGRGRLKKKKNQQKKKTKNRFEVFSQWIISKFGIPFLKSKNGVLDIACGKGNVSFNLIKYSIRCCLVDPMPLKLSEKKTKEILFETAFNNQSGLSIDELIGLDHRISWLNKIFFKNIKFNEENIKELSKKLDNLGITHHKHLFHSDSDECIKLIKNSSLIFGLHPDEATEDIVKAALKEKVPFAIVPCCVFPTLFPNRIGKDGLQVRSLDQFLDYLQELDFRIKREVITSISEPNNVCLYFIPSDLDNLN